MIDYQDNRIKNGAVNEEIKRWEVWFMTPFGVTDDLQQAIDSVKSVDMEPNLVIKAVPVAVSEGTHEVSV